MGPCDQWSRNTPGRATLVRHILETTAYLPLAPPSCPGGMGQATRAGALIPTRGLTPRNLTVTTPARTAAIEVAVVTVAAQRHLDATPCAEE